VSWPGGGTRQAYVARMGVPAHGAYAAWGRELQARRAACGVSKDGGSRGDA
jgi:hypothetical protein